MKQAIKSESTCTEIMPACLLLLGLSNSPISLNVKAPAWAWKDQGGIPHHLIDTKTLTQADSLG